MKIDQIIFMLTNRLAFLQSQRTLSVSIGDVLKVGETDIEIAETQESLDRIKTLS